MREKYSSTITKMGRALKRGGVSFYGYGILWERKLVR